MLGNAALQIRRNQPAEIVSASLHRSIFRNSRLPSGEFLSITKKQKGGEAMKIKVNVRAGSTVKARA